MKLFDDRLIINIPESFEIMTVDEVKIVFRNTGFNYAFIDRNKNAVMGIVLKDGKLDKEGVEKKISDYYIMYSRLAPGFILGEMKVKYGDRVNIGALTFKSNAPTRDLFNIVSVSNFFDQELFLMFSCNIKDSVYYLPQITKFINEIETSQL